MTDRQERIYEHPAPYDSGPYRASRKPAESTKCKVCGQDKGRGSWIKPYGGERAFVCPECYNEVQEARTKGPYSALADKLALALTGFFANRKLARRRVI